MHWLNLNTSIALHGVILPNVLQSMTSLDGRNSGAMFTDPLMTTFYHLDGNGAPNNSTISSFHATTPAWTNASVSGGNFNIAYTAAGVCATTSTSGLGLSFITGGDTTYIPP